MAEDQVVPQLGSNGHGHESELRALEDVLLARARFARQVGISFEGKRDYYRVLGYDRDITALQLRETYNRGGLAKRIVEAYPKATWRGGVEVYEDEDPDVKTKFETEFKELDKRIQIWSNLERADILAGQSTYSVILLGVADGSLDTPLPKGNPKKLLYLQPYWGGGGPSGSVSPRTVAAEVDATIQEYDVDPKSARFGEPLYYSLKRTTIQLPQDLRKVHWTRIIHVAEGCLDDNVFGIPTLESVWNLLQDLMKVTGGGAEAFWLRADPGLHANLDKDMSLSNADGALTKIAEDMERYEHGLTRWIRTRGVDVNTLGSDVANFSQSADAVIKQIAGAKGIPLRILTGSEMGQLASGQDAENWNSQIQDRRTGYAGPMIVRRLVDRLIEYGYLPEPKQYEVGWPVEEELTEPEKADLAVKLAQANNTMGAPLFTEAEIREKAFDMKPLTDEQKKELEDQAAKKQEEAIALVQAKNPPDEEEAFGKKKAELKAAGEDELLRVLEDALEAGADDVVAQIIGLGGKGSGFYGHVGRPGHLGGSARRGGIGQPVSAYPRSFPGGRDTQEQFSDGHGNYTEERERLHEEIMQKMMEGTTSVDDPSAIILGGPPGGGKTTLVEREGIGQENTVKVSVDEIRDYLPEYAKDASGKRPPFTAFTHEEASDISAKLIKRAAGERRNIVLDGTGDSTVEKLGGKIAVLRSKGLDVEGVYVTVPLAVAQARADTRGLKIGRMVPPSDMAHMHRQVSRVFPEAIKQGLFSRAKLFNSEGDKPVLVASAVGRKLKVHNRKMWDAFLAGGQ